MTARLRREDRFFDGLTLPEPPPDLGSRIARSAMAAHGRRFSAGSRARRFRLRPLDGWLVAWAMLLLGLLVTQSGSPPHWWEASRHHPRIELAALAEELGMAPEKAASLLPRWLDLPPTGRDLERRKAAVHEVMEALR